MIKNLLNNSKTLPICILLLGLGVALFLSHIFQNIEQSKIKQAILADAEARILLISQEVETNIDVLRSLKAFYNSSTYVDREEFKSFTAPLLENHTDIKTLEWVLKVPKDKLETLKNTALQQGISDFEITETYYNNDIVPVQSDRDFYYPIFYVEPMKGNRDKIGYDLGSSKIKLDALIKSSELKKEIATPPVTLLNDDMQNKHVLFFAPVYKNITSATNTDVKKTINNISGFVLMTLNIYDVINHALNETYNELHDNYIRIDDVTDPNNIINIINKNADRATDKDFQYKDFITVSGRQWQINLIPDTAWLYNKESSSISSLIFWSSFLFTLFIAVIVFQLISRKAAIQKTVKEQTSELEKNKKKIEEALNFQDLILKTIPDFVFVKDKDFKIIQANDAFLELYPPEKRDHIIGYTTLEEYPKNEVDAFLKQDKIAFKKGFSEVEERITFPDGKVRTVLTKKTRFEGLDDEPYILGTSRDLTDFLEATEDLKNMGRIIEDSLNEVFIFDAKTYLFVHVNSGAMNNIGYSKEELLKMTPIDIKPDYTKESYQEIVAPLNNGAEKKIIFETAHQRKDKSLYDVEIHLQKSFFQGKDVYVAIIMDITERKKFEEELMRSNTELERFAYVAAHDMQEPLRTVVSFAELLERNHLSSLDGEAQEFLGYCVKGANQMKVLVDDLLEYSRAGDEEEHLEDVDINATIGLAIDNLQEIIDRKKAVINIGKMPIIPGNAIRMMRVFQNFIGNALKYQEADVKPIIDIDVKDSPEAWIFSIKDNGIGIKKEYHQKIFEPFKRLHRRATYPGTGIGLAICIKILNNRGGRIWVESEEGKGATFFFSIPKGIPEQCTRESKPT